MGKGKRVTIKNKLRFMVLSIIVLAIFVVSMIAVIIMFRIRTRSKNSIINERYDNVRDLLYEKTTIADLSINEYVRYNDMAASLAEMIYDNKDQYINKEIPIRGIDSPEVYLLQRSYNNMDVDKAKVKEEMSLLANLESIWEPMMKESGNFIATAYAGTESGFMISYDMNADKAEYSEDGEVYFNHKDRPWFLEAKKQGKLIFTDIEQDYFGRGLSLTCAKPFYHNGEFAGVVAMDILVSDLQKAIIDMEEDDNTILFIVDVPTIEKMQDENDIYTTMPLGMIVVRDDFFITVSLKKNKVIQSFEKSRIKNFETYKKSRFIFQILYMNASFFLKYLKQINKETEIAEYI